MEVTNELFEKYGKISPFIVNRYFSKYDDFYKEILILAGYEGICDGIEKYDASMGTTLSGFIATCCINKIRSKIRVDSRYKNKNIPISEFEKKIENIDGRNLSFREPIDFEDENNNIEELIDEDYNKFLIKKAICAINKLDRRSKKFIVDYILGSNASEIARKYGFSHQWVSWKIHQIEKKLSIDKLDNQYNEV